MVGVSIVALEVVSSEGEEKAAENGAVERVVGGGREMRTGGYRKVVLTAVAVPVSLFHAGRDNAERGERLRFLGVHEARSRGVPMLRRGPFPRVVVQALCGVSFPLSTPPL